MATASGMILTALISIGEKQIGETLSTAEETHYLSKLNSMLESWSIDRLMCYQIVQESLALTASTGSYTIGSGGAFNTTRPTKIVDPCFIRDSSNYDSPLEIINAEAYGRIVSKTVDGTYPSYLFYNTAFVSSLGTIFLYPEPAASLTLFINSWRQLAQFSAIGDTMVLPPGYQLAIESNFAIHAAPGLTNVSPELLSVAKESKAAIKRLNAPDPIMKLDAGVVRGRRASILTGP
ncbi:MAG: hypothetical protein Q7N50_02840 [Armatimonadota bacterium]|nr:hypothetical protein [Armatimonadota bacterium]